MADVTIFALTAAFIACVVYVALSAWHALYTAVVYMAERVYTRRRLCRLHNAIVTIGGMYTTAQTEAERAYYRAALLEQKAYFDNALQHVSAVEAAQALRKLYTAIQSI